MSPQLIRIPFPQAPKLFPRGTFEPEGASPDEELAELVVAKTTDSLLDQRETPLAPVRV